MTPPTHPTPPLPPVASAVALALAPVALAVAAAVLTFFGLMHSEGIGIGESPMVALSYLCIAALMAGCSRLSTVPLSAQEIEAEHGDDLVAHSGQGA